ncbi:hypothetical protein K450DRAFT_227199 [Umbelopsis ramanniana AG]|uniref:Uncharacterized protein n=1 Tax=Umbelopsis ramanniana AG TaxID=1314678 RepID=A0AAD5EG83_UMBRA|nr:uncharacterized protein K450DRAFT_227199 [Umbelopsis ramanniana AG]KAI8582440.1 hypothetical protein K450DRAFT_227199 [Umbelopsis ramanniana AG]
MIPAISIFTRQSIYSFNSPSHYQRVSRSLLIKKSRRGSRTFLLGVYNFVVQLVGIAEWSIWASRSRKADGYLTVWV